MKNWLIHLDPQVQNLLQAIGRHADELHLPAFVVGGFVRDVLLQRKNLDLDIVVEGDAVAFSESLAKHWKASVVVYKQFGTATLTLLEGIKIDFATARSEIYPTSGSLPVVQPGTLKDDLLRRDFTINAMALSINAAAFGQLFDKFSGWKDLQSKKIRILHDMSFKDDPTRILRAVRFEQRFGFRLEKHTERLLKEALRKQYERQVKPERYFDEFKKILNEGSPERSLRRLIQLRGLGFLGLKNQPSAFQLMKKIPQTLSHFRKTYPNRRIEDRWLLFFMALLECSSKSVLENILIKFNLKNTDRAKLRSFLGRLKIRKALKAKKLKPSQVFVLLKPLSHEEFVLLQAQSKDLTTRKRINDYLQRYSKVQLTMSGADLLELGIPQNDTMGKVLNHILYDKIDGLILSRKDELKKARDFKSLLDRRRNHESDGKNK